jgi:hypothetical protein
VNPKKPDQSMEDDRETMVRCHARRRPHRSAALARGERRADPARQRRTGTPTGAVQRASSPAFMAALPDSSATVGGAAVGRQGPRARPASVTTVAPGQVASVARE